MLCLNTACTNISATCQRFCLLFLLFNYFLCEFSTSRLEKFVWFKPLPLKGHVEYHLGWMFRATWFYRDHFLTWISLKCSIGQGKKKALKSFTIKYSYKLLKKKKEANFNIYNSKTWSVAFIVTKSHQRSRHYLFFFSFFNQFFYNCFWHLFFLIFTLLQTFSFPYLFIFPLLLQSFSLPYLFNSPPSSKLISFFLFPLIFLYFRFFLFTPFYYKFIAISSILYILFPHNKKVLSLSLKFLVGFLFFLHICFRLIIFYIL